ncbi:hypothetical protein L484_008866 [Morus notabilis]|uniref:Uncharacterized protein n=1 Tax=Morus notabilis TaxID=981085 RepID=W9RG13_9ROSA|nr:hypothetical protein L484_008866 [Morus notabilis]
MGHFREPKMTINRILRIQHKVLEMHAVLDLYKKETTTDQMSYGLCFSSAKSASLANVSRSCLSVAVLSNMGPARSMWPKREK